MVEPLNTQQQRDADQQLDLVASWYGQSRYPVQPTNRFLPQSISLLESRASVPGAHWGHLGQMVKGSCAPVRSYALWMRIGPLHQVNQSPLVRSRAPTRALAAPNKMGSCVPAPTDSRAVTSLFFLRQTREVTARRKLRQFRCLGRCAKMPQTLCAVFSAPIGDFSGLCTKQCTAPTILTGGNCSSVAQGRFDSVTVLRPHSTKPGSHSAVKYPWQSSSAGLRFREPYRPASSSKGKPTACSTPCSHEVVLTA